MCGDPLHKRRREPGAARFKMCAAHPVLHLPMPKPPPPMPRPGPTFGSTKLIQWWCEETWFRFETWLRVVRCMRAIGGRAAPKVAARLDYENLAPTIEGDDDDDRDETSNVMRPHTLS
eukprot:scaffold59096_cov61-Phaeocystis_antarctica.AAC.1